MADQASLGYVAQGREGTGEAQIYNTQPLTQQFTNYAMNYLQQKQEKERVAAQQKREDEKENAKNFARDFEYNLETWQPFEQALRQKKDELVQDFTSELTKNPDFAKTYAVGSEAWQKAQKKKNEMESFVKRANDYKEEWQTASKQVLDLQKSGRYNTTEQLAKLRELADKQYEKIDDYSSGSIKEALSHPSMINPIGVAQDMVTKNLKNVQMEIDKYTREGNIGKVTKLKQNVPTFVKRTADGSIDMSTGQPEINPNDPSFIQFVNSDDEMSRRLDYDMEQALAKNPNLDKAKFRQEQALGYFNNLIAKENKIADSNVKDETLEAEQFKKKLALDWWKAKEDKADKDRNFNLKSGAGSGKEENADALIGKWGDIVTGQAKEWDDAPTIQDDNGKQFKQIDAQNLGGGGLRPDGTALGSFYKDADGKTYYTLRVKDATGNFKEDINKKYPMKENDIDLFNSTVLNNKNIPKEMKDAVQKRLKERGVVGTFGGADWKKALTTDFKPTDLSNLNLSDYDKMVKYHKEKVANPLALTADQKAEYISLRNKYKWMKDEALEDEKTVEAIKAAKQETTKESAKTEAKPEVVKKDSATIAKNQASFFTK